MIVETRRKRNTYKDPIIIWEYQTNREKGIIEKVPFYVIERAKSFKFIKQKGYKYFNYGHRSILGKKES